jgi:uncharacterized protein (TIGR02611 family)
MRPLRIVGGFVLLGGGVLMLVTPGPGWLAIAGGLSLLAADFPWARHLLDRVKQRIEKLRG